MLCKNWNHSLFYDNARNPTDRVDFESQWLQNQIQVLKSQQQVRVVSIPLPEILVAHHQWGTCPCLQRAAYPAQLWSPAVLFPHAYSVPTDFTRSLWMQNISVPMFNNKNGISQAHFYSKLVKESTLKTIHMFWKISAITQTSTPEGSYLHCLLLLEKLQNQMSNIPVHKYWEILHTSTDIKSRDDPIIRYTKGCNIHVYKKKAYFDSLLVCTRHNFSWGI
jgi:hypothetical protein